MVKEAVQDADEHAVSQIDGQGTTGNPFTMESFKQQERKWRSTPPMNLPSPIRRMVFPRWMLRENRVDVKAFHNFSDVHSQGCGKASRFARWYRLFIDSI